jgi:hypothetical protein
MKGAPARRARRRAISVLPTPVGPIIRMFLGVISLRSTVRPVRAASGCAARWPPRAWRGLADDVLVEFGDDFLRGHLGHGGYSVTGVAARPEMSQESGDIGLLRQAQVSRGFR